MKKLCMILPLALILCFMVSCQDKAAKEELEAMKAQTEVEEQNKALVNRVYEVVNKGDIEAYKEMLAPEYVWYLPSRSTKPISRKEIVEFVKMLQNGFPDFVYSVEDLIAEGDIVISRFIFKGTHEGEFQGIPATGNKVEMSGFMMTRIENGKLVEDKEEYDGLGFMQQLGMELKPTKAKK